MNIWLLIGVFLLVIIVIGAISAFNHGIADHFKTRHRRKYTGDLGEALGDGLDHMFDNNDDERRYSRRTRRRRATS
ncbi:MAG TPA: hypothetical protein VL461_09195 [Dictyobacter sp.]|jgi:hypothetical protein|nr:hypothetical protein [Dictyobacter sp.]